MEVIRVKQKDIGIINDLLAHHIDCTDRREKLPSLSHLKNLLDDDRSYLYAAICDGVVSGYTLAYRFPSLYASEYLAYLYDMEVSPEFRRQGIGRSLLESVLEQLKADGVKEVWLGTAVDNVEGQHFFHSTGAIKSGETFNDYTYYLT